MAQEHVTRSGGGGEDEEFEQSGSGGGQERLDRAVEDTDDLLDDIDGVLEENAEDFVRAYVQKGGQ